MKNFPIVWKISALVALLIGALQAADDTGDRPPKPYLRFIDPDNTFRLLRRYLPQNPIIVEAGAYDGKDTCSLARFWPGGHIHSFEPVRSLFDNVCARVASHSNVNTYNLALGKERGKAIFYLSEEASHPNEVFQSSSLFPPKDHLVYASSISFEKTEVVNVITLDDWAADNGIEKVDLLWLDMQGYELPALKAAPKILSGVSAILTELEFVEAYEGQPLYREVKEWLESQGFVMVGGNFDFPKDPRQWFGDGLFVRKELIATRKKKV